jgi:uncharacterized membrane protein
MSKNQGKRILTIGILGIIGLALVIVFAYQIPSVKARLSWRVDIAMTYLRGVIYPVKPFPTPAESVILPTQAATNTPTNAAQPDSNPSGCRASSAVLGAARRE